MNEREKLIEKLKKQGLRLGAIKVCTHEDAMITLRAQIADFILLDRKDQEDKMRGMFEAEIEKAKDKLISLNSGRKVSDVVTLDREKLAQAIAGEGFNISTWDYSCADSIISNLPELLVKVEKGE